MEKSSNIDAGLVKNLRSMTGAGFVDCKNALVETKGDMDKAVEILRKKGLAKAQKKANREAKEGLIYSYIHAGGRIGVLLEINCETDFVARTSEFQELAKNIAMHIAASNPLYIKRELVSPELVSKEREIYKEQLAAMDKPQAVKEKIVDGKLEKYYQDVCLLEQPFIKDPSKNIAEIIDNEVAKLGENIVLKRFVRYQLGE
ncbi:MAG: translation elongation factor Ts [Deltaproteobacteria bacterium]|nr:translation elongation factor Ts [Deltaproteobacteria bacterium]